ncbi:MAG: ABC transporter substrate-binding protein, partial [bacterium]
MGQSGTTASGKLRLSIAISDYDHVRDLTEGRVRAEGIELIPLNFSVEEIFYRFVSFVEWDVSELSMAKYVSLISQDQREITAIPVFPSRVFRHSAFFVSPDSEVKTL